MMRLPTCLRNLALLLGTSSFVTVAAACGAPPADSAGETAPIDLARVDLVGTFETDDATSAYTRIAFYRENRIAMTQRGCSVEGSRCVVAGTFAFDAASRALKVVPDGGGAAFTLAFEVTAVADAPAPTSTVRPKNAQNPLLPGVPQPLLEDRCLAVRRFLVNGNSFNGGPDGGIAAGDAKLTQADLVTMLGQRGQARPLQGEDLLFITPQGIPVRGRRVSHDEKKNGFCDAYQEDPPLAFETLTGVPIGMAGPACYSSIGRRDGALASGLTLKEIAEAAQRGMMCSAAQLPAPTQPREDFEAFRRRADGWLRGDPPPG